MHVAATKHPSELLRQLNAHIKHCRAADQIVQSRWQSNVARGDCSRLISYGRYTPKFKLVLVRDLRDGCPSREGAPVRNVS